MATKTATVQSGQTAGTNTNFPAYVDLTDVGVTTLAEAESIRVYSDSGLTTELAREIVSATEMHVKIPTLTSSTQIWIDYDGIRADYAATDTYGRNAVWGDYERVYHFQETSGAVVDSTGNDDGTNNGATTGVTGQMGNGYDFDGTNDVINGITSVGTLGTDNISIQCLFKSDGFNSGVNQRDQLVVNYGGSSNRIILTRSHNSGRMQIDTFDGATVRSHGRALSDTTGFHHFVGQTTSAKVLSSYLDGVAGTASTYIGGGNASDGTLQIGADLNASYHWDGIIDEVRLRLSILSADWITTEYNNQNDNSAFWGTWTDADAGGAFTKPNFKGFSRL